MLEGYSSPTAKAEDSVAPHLPVTTEATGIDDSSDASEVDATVIAQTPEDLTPRWEDSDCTKADEEFARLFAEQSKEPKNVSKAPVFLGEANDELVARWYGKGGNGQNAYKSNSQIRTPSTTSGKISHGSTKSASTHGTIASTLSYTSSASTHYIESMLDTSPLPEDDPTKTTVMARNIPPNFTRAMLTCLLDGNGFLGHYNFLYLPVDFGTLRSFGYAVVNFVTHADAVHFGHFFHGFQGLVDEAGNHMSGVVEWSGALQGLENHVERYRDSPMMHPRVRDELKPMLFARGQRVAFPPPTKVLKMPRRAKGERGDKSFIACPGELISNAVGLAMTYTPLNQTSWQTPHIPDAAARAMHSLQRRGSTISQSLNLGLKFSNLPR
jgi:hypothetical protein